MRAWVPEVKEYCPPLSTHVLWFQAKEASAAEDMSANCATLWIIVCVITYGQTIASVNNFVRDLHSFPRPLPFLLHEPRQSVSLYLSCPVPVTAWLTGLRSQRSRHRRTEPEDSTRDLRPLQALGAEALMVEGQVGQPASVVLDRGLGASPLWDMPELPGERRTAT